MAQPEPSSDDVVRAVYEFAAERMRAGVGEGQIEQELVDKGLQPQDAKTVVQNLADARSAAVRSAAKKNMLFGALWCIGGTVITVWTYQAAANNPGGGSYVVAWGAIIFGAIQFFRGLMQSAG